MADLRQRLDGQLAMSEEQVRATERALRKGLASLGEKLAGTEATYADAGNALRRSIERLGAAVVEADARMADQIPALPVEGCVAFAPTAAGYRLVEIAGIPPEIGDDRARRNRRAARRHPLRPLAAPTRQPTLRISRPRLRSPANERLRPAEGGPQPFTRIEACYLRFFCFAIAPATRSPVMNMWL